MLCVAGPKSGGAINPAVGFAQTSFEMMMYGRKKNLDNYFWVYVLGPYTGGLVAGIIWRGHIHSYSIINQEGKVLRSGSKLIA
jgi:glycerol uptake facilitator-like aquaporin